MSELNDKVQALHAAATSLEGTATALLAQAEQKNAALTDALAQKDAFIAERSAKIAELEKLIADLTGTKPPPPPPLDTDKDGTPDATDTDDDNDGDPDVTDPAPLDPLVKTPPVSTPPVNGKLPTLGINLTEIGYFQPVPFTDVLQSAKWDDGQQKFKVYIDLGYIPAGTFTPTDPSVTVERKSSGLWITAPQDARERGIKVFLPGYNAQSGPFNKPFLDSLKPYSVLRFMDWTRTNHSDVVTWEQFTAKKPGNRIDINLIPVLCNGVDADPWVCIPHMADTNLARQYGAMLKAKLEPGRKVYVEYSNEVLFNFMFGQAKWIETKARAEGVNQGTAAGRVAKPLFAAFMEGWGSNPERVIRVIAGQQSQPYTAKKMAEVIGKGNFEAFSCTTYFSAEKSVRAGWTASTTPDTITNETRKGIATINPRLREWVSAGSTWGVPVLAYEGGSHSSPEGAAVPWLGAYVSAHESQAMGQVYADAFKDAKTVGIKAWVHFNHAGLVGKYGPWPIYKPDFTPRHTANGLMTEAAK